MGCRKLTYWNEVKIPSYRDSQKTTSKTEGTPIFEMGGKQVSDYYLFGMFCDACFSSSEKLSRTNPDKARGTADGLSGQMPGRHGSDNSEGEYRYGFNGMEKDDEVKGISGSSYDFGARMYDSRVGRWFSRDALANKKPFLTPYQAMKNSPLMYGDPDGNDEYLKIIVNVEGRSKPIVLNSMKAIKQNTFMAGMILYSGDTRVFPEQNFHDYTTVITIKMDKEGNVIGEPSTAREAEGGPTHKETLYLGWFDSGKNEGVIVDNNSSYSQPGGFYMTSENGMGTIFTSENSPKFVGNIDDLMTAANAINRANTIDMVRTGAKFGLDALDDMVMGMVFDAFLRKAIEAAKENTTEETGTADAASTGNPNYGEADDVKDSADEEIKVQIKIHENHGMYQRTVTKDTVVKRADSANVQTKRSVNKY